MTREEIDEKLRRHGLWLEYEEGGERAVFSGANLTGADLRHADLRNANLSGANLRGADLRNADLRTANLRNADLRGAKLGGANLMDANLSGAHLWNADMRRADLTGAHLWNADLTGADLRYVNLSGAIGLIDPIEWLAQFERDSDGIIVYKRIGSGTKCGSQLPDHWVIEPGSILTEVCHSDRTLDCACGVNFGTLEWCHHNYTSAELWRCRIRTEWWFGVVVPYNTDGKARCSRLELLDRMEV